jgi:glycine/D-amino acid oxidase-like deaminating enzyme
MALGVTREAIVVGAGIVGAACAFALARAGWRVTVFEADVAGAGTTAAAMGHLVAMDDSPAQLALSGWALELWRDWLPHLPADCEVDARGTLWLAADEEELHHVRVKADTYACAGLAAEVLDAQALRVVEPHLRHGLAGALHVPGDQVLYPPAAARALLALAARHGAGLLEGHAVRALEAAGVRTDGGRFEADVIVNAAGCAAPLLTPGLPITPRRGQLAISERCPGLVRHQLVELGYLKSAHGTDAPSVAFNVQPRATGQLLIGSSREYVGFDTRPNVPLRARMLRRALDFVPALAQVSVLRTWLGYRPATPDKLPLIGRWPAVPRLWIAAGHEGLGITTALASAQLLVDLIEARKPPIDPAPYGPERAFESAHA